MHDKPDIIFGPNTPVLNTTCVVIGMAVSIIAFYALCFGTGVYLGCDVIGDGWRGCISTGIITWLAIIAGVGGIVGLIWLIATLADEFAKVDKERNKARLIKTPKNRPNEVRRYDLNKTYQPAIRRPRGKNQTMNVIPK